MQVQTIIITSIIWHCTENLKTAGVTAVFKFHCRKTLKAKFAHLRMQMKHC